MRNQTKNSWFRVKVKVEKSPFSGSGTNWRKR